MSEAYIQAANTMIGDKLLYASAHPFVDFRQALQTYQELPFTPEVRQKVMHDNAAKLLGLETAPAAAATGNVASADLVKDIVSEVLARLGK